MASDQTKEPKGQSYLYATTPGDLGISSQEKYLKKSRFYRSGRFQVFRLSFLLLFLTSLMVTLGVILVTSAQLHTYINFPYDLLRLKTYRTDIGPFSLPIPCIGPKRSSQNERYHDDEAVFGGMRQSNSKVGKLSMEVIKRGVSNGTGIMDELLTAPLNTPSTTIPSSSISTISSSATSFVTSATSSAASQTTSLITSSSSQALNPGTNTGANTMSTQISSSSFNQLTTGSPKITTLTGNSSDNNDLPTPTTPVTDTLSTINTPIPQQTIYTTTLPDGDISTITSITIVETDAEPSDSVVATKTKPSAGLQTGIACANQALPFRKLMGIFGIILTFVW